MKKSRPKIVHLHRRVHRRYRFKKLGDFRLVVTYCGGLDQVLDRQLFKLAGKPSAGSGCGINGPDAGVRDHDWYFTTRSQALAALKRVRETPFERRLKLKARLTGPIEPVAPAPLPTERAGAPRRRSVGHP